MESKIYIYLICLLLTTHVSSETRINGFASIVAGLDTDDKSFVNTPYTDELSFKPESKFALQISTDLSDDLTAVAQIMARGANDFNAEFEWAYLSYDINENYTIRVGKLRIPFYKYSDYLDVGYAYPWIRPPRAMYSLTFSTYEGFSLISNFSLSDWDISSNIMYGNVDGTFFETTLPTDGTLTDSMGINVQLSKEWFSMYFAYLGTKVDIPRSDFESISQIVDLVSPGDGTSIKLDNDYADFLGIGFTIDHENWLFNSEWSNVAIEDSITLDSAQWYTSLAYRFDNVMPYITYQTTETKRKKASISNNRIPAQIHPAQPPLNMFIQGILDSQIFEYKAYTLGVRYDFHPSAALKLEYNRYFDIVDNDSLGSISDPETSGNITVAIDLVF